MAPPNPPPRNGRSVKIVLKMLLFLIGNALKQLNLVPLRQSCLFFYNQIIIICGIVKENPLNVIYNLNTGYTVSSTLLLVLL